MLRDIEGELPSNTDWEIRVVNEGRQPVATVRIQGQCHLPWARTTEHFF
jgi:hypothetical protein